jgi:transcriptional regulator with XRE-family HTH domain
MADAGINQRELARLCDVQPPSVNGWLSGKSKFLRGENLLQAANALNVSDQWLATGKGQKARSPSYSQSVRLDPEIVRDVARALQEVYRDELGLVYDIVEEPELFAEMYERTAERGEANSRSNLVWLGTKIKASAPQGAPMDERSASVVGQGDAKGKAGNRRAKG